MSYKLGLLLSITFLMSILLLFGDLLNVSIIQNSLHSLSLVFSYRIQKEARITTELTSLVHSYGATYTVETGGRTAFRIGETITYRLSKDYTPFIMRKGTMHVTVRRSAVIGYYTV